jgi:hypothetical protein
LIIVNGKLLINFENGERKGIEGLKGFYFIILADVSVDLLLINDYCLLENVVEQK